ncbi:MAG: hypothetical protein J6S91_06655 [Treponema sp.]|nr:hypothetical protein [Treponema sp.]
MENLNDNADSETDKSQDDLRARCADMAVKFKFLFIISIIALVIHIAFFIFSLILLFTSNYATISTASIPLSIVYMMADVLFSIVLISLSRHHSSFKFAGILNLLASFFSNFTNFIRFFTISHPIGSSSLNSIVLLFPILSDIFWLIYMLEMTNAMISVFEPVSLAVKVSWRDFRQWNIYVFVAEVICSILAFIPGIYLISMLAGVFVTLANMIVFIWKFTILY